VLDTNVGGVFNVTRAVVPYMIMQRAGRIINLSSVSASKGGRGQTNYAASKGAIEAFTRALAVELAPRNVLVNAVAPGVIETPLWDVADEKLSRLNGQQPGVARAQRIAAVPLGRAGTPEDVAAATSFLLSADASYITGETLHVCGGDVML
jgi:NAD(P)-dependent dehydrogenase (short-subunit alcohol dehydrogenase family)